MRPLEPSGEVSAAPTPVAEQPKDNPKDSTTCVSPHQAELRETNQEKAKKLEGRRQSLCEMLARTGLSNDIHPDVLKTLERPIQMPLFKGAMEGKSPVEEPKRDVATPLDISQTGHNENSGREYGNAEVNGKKVGDAPPLPTNRVYEALKSKAKGYFFINKPGPELQSAVSTLLAFKGMPCISDLIHGNSLSFFSADGILL